MLCIGPTSHALRKTYSPEARIRTLSVSLLAVAAIAASVLLSRNRQEKAADESAPEHLSAHTPLDAIRAAGL